MRTFVLSWVAVGGVQNCSHARLLELAAAVDSAQSGPNVTAFLTAIQKSEQYLETAQTSARSLNLFDFSY